VQVPTDQKIRALHVPQRMRADRLDRSLRGWNRSSPRFLIWSSGERERHNRLCKTGRVVTGGVPPVASTR
jgi:hypothetical protein